MEMFDSFIHGWLICRIHKKALKLWHTTYIMDKEIVRINVQD